MSDTIDAAPPLPPTAAPAAPDLFSRALAIATHAASWVYHGVLAIESDVAAWTSNPAINALVKDGMAYMETLLATHGIPVAALGTLEQGFMAALRGLAAADPTVTSGTSVPAKAAAS